MDDWGKGLGIGRAGEPNQVAPALLFLGYEDPSYQSGQVPLPNGGSVVSG